MKILVLPLFICSDSPRDGCELGGVSVGPLDPKEKGYVNVGF